jgi:murein L,D-transpeptidase YafK
MVIFCNFTVFEITQNYTAHRGINICRFSINVWNCNGENVLNFVFGSKEPSKKKEKKVATVLQENLILGLSIVGQPFNN